MENLKPDGQLYIVDFWDQRGWPPPFRLLLRAWLGWFHVRYDPELPVWLENLERTGAGVLSLESVMARYALLAVFHPSPAGVLVSVD